ncbi:hypothetical protein Hanom_Chr07g00616821 [Helianthus anomalus]
MPLRSMEQDFHTYFKGWIYNQSTTEAIITLFDVNTRDCRRIHIVCKEPDKVQAQQYQKIVNVCFAKDINSRRYGETKFRDLELEEFMKTERRSERFKKIKA